jgi:hypothetical protein
MILAILMLTPLLEMHYFAALLIVVALCRPQFGPAWVAPLLIWGAHATVSGSSIQVARVLLVAAVTVALALGDWETSAARLSFGRPSGRLSKWLAVPGRKGAGPSLTPP